MIRDILSSALKEELGKRKLSSNISDATECFLLCAFKGNFVSLKVWGGAGIMLKPNAYYSICVCSHGIKCQLCTRSLTLFHLILETTFCCR